MSVAIFVISESEVKVYLTTRYKVLKGLKIIKSGLCMVLAYFELKVPI